MRATGEHTAAIPIHASPPPQTDDDAERRRRRRPGRRPKQPATPHLDAAGPSPCRSMPPPARADPSPSPPRTYRPEISPPPFPAMASPGPAPAGELLRIDPIELRFPFELKKQISCSMQLSNLSDDYIAFKMKTTSPKKYSVRPNTGVVLPRSTCDVVVTMQAQREVPPDMQCKDKFLVQSVIAPSGINVKDVTGEMFMKESGNTIEEVKLRLTYVAPPQPPSPVPEESEEGSPSRGESENGDGPAGGFTRALRERIEPQEKSVEAGVLISKLTDEKNSAIQQNHKIRQELDMMRRDVSKRHGGGFSFVIVIIVALMGIFLGYMMKS